MRSKGQECEQHWETGLACSEMLSSVTPGWDGCRCEMEVLCFKTKGLWKVIFNLTTILFEILLSKQLVSQEGISIRLQKFKGNSGVMGWRRQEAGGDLVGTGLLLSPAVLPHVSPDQRAAPGQEVREKKGEKKKRGFKYRLETKGV